MSSVPRAARFHPSLGVFAVASLVGCASATEPPTVAIVDQSGTDRAHTDSTPIVKHNAGPKEMPSTGYSLYASSGTGSAVGPRYGSEPDGPPFDAACSEALDKTNVCGTQGRVVIERLGHPLQGETPCKLASLTRESERSFTPEVTSACVVGDELVATAVCMMCRMPDSGFAVHARISEMKPDQAQQIFEQLGLEGTAPTDADGWQAAIDRGQPPRNQP